MEDIDPGGAERSIIQLAGSFAAHGYQVDLVVGSAAGPYKKEIDSSVNLLEIGTRNKIVLVLKISKYLKQHNPFIVMGALDTANIILLAAGLSAGYKGKIIWGQRASTQDPTRKKYPLRRVIFSLLKKILIKRVNLVITNSHAASDEMEKQTLFNGKRIFVIPNLINIDKINNQSFLPLDLTGIKRRNEQIVLSVGSVTKRKNLETVVRAFQIVKKNKQNVKLVILGQGYQPKEFKRIQDLVKDLNLEANVLMPGFDSNPYRWMRAAKVLISASSNEGFPNILAEGLALNCRIVATDCPGDTAWLLGYGRWGRLVPVGDYVTMSDKILEALDDQSTTDTTRRAREFAPEAIQRAYENIFFS